MAPPVNRPTTPRAARPAPPRHLSEEPVEKLDLGRLVGYSVKGLFGDLDYDFDLDLEEPTILTGANGAGKSTVLGTVYAVSRGQWGELMEMPFRSLVLSFERGPQLRVKKEGAQLTVSYGRRGPWELDFNEPAARALLSEEDPALLGERLAWEGVEEIPPFERQRVMRRWRAEAIAETRRHQPDWLRSFVQSFSVRFITDQRLVIHDPEVRPGRRTPAREEIRKAVSEYEDDLKRRITFWLNRYASASQREDRGFPQLVVEALMKQEPVDVVALEELIQDVATRRAALEAVGLVEGGEEPTPRFVEDQLMRPDVGIVIKTFAEVTMRKFETLEEARKRLELFVTFLRQHFVGKQPITSAQEGLRFRLSEGTELKPSQLSSGEQQMLVLAYQLLFEAAPDTLMLIDEPEISLHVGWQSTFIDDITAMGQERGLQFLLATHSPTLIGGREDLKRPLGVARS